MPIKIDPDAVTHSMSEYGVALVILSFVLLLLFVYFWKMINQKSSFERMFESQRQMIASLIKKVDKVKDDLLIIRTRLEGNFRVRGMDEDE